MWAVALAQAAVGLSVIAGVPAVIDRWPFPGTTPLTFTFLGSILLAASASSAWCVLANEPAGLVGVGIDYLTILVPFIIFVLVADIDDRGPLVVAVLPTVAFGVWLLAAFRDASEGTARTPTVVRGAFAAFSAVLLVVAVALFAGSKVLPWPVSDDVAVVVGLMFLGAAAYFVFGVVRGVWTHAGGQLAGFLAYDVVLIGPLVARVPDVTSEDAVSLTVYLAVVVSSGVLAGWYLLRGPLPR